MTLIDKRDFKEQKWKNGLGITHEIAVYPPGSSLSDPQLLWRISSAEIRSSCPFSLFPGYERFLAIVRASTELSLVFQSGRKVVLQTGDVTHFSGSDPIHGFIEERPDAFIVDFNVIYSPIHVNAMVESVTLGNDNGGRSFEVDSEITFVYCITGPVLVTYADSITATNKTVVLSPECVFRVDSTAAARSAASTLLQLSPAIAADFCRGLLLMEYRDLAVSVPQALAATFALFFFVLVLCIGLGSLTVSFLRYSFKPSSVSANKSQLKAPGVSILRPMKGVDAHLVENLASSFKLQYPNFEILCSVADANDPAIQVVKNLMKQYPHVDAKLIVGEAHFGVNPKVNNLITSYAVAKNEIVWILDSNIFVDPETLGRAVDCLLLPNVGLVHHIPIGVEPESFGTAVEQVYLNAAHAKLYTIINKLKLGSCVIGKSNIFRKSELDHVGGLQYFGKYMSEDNIMGRAIWDQGRLHMIPADVVYQPLGKGRLWDYFQRRARWTRMRKYMDIVAVLLEPFSECLLNSFFASIGFEFFFGISRHVFIPAHIFYWFLLDCLMAFVIHKGMVLDNFPRFVAAWVVREITSLPVHLYACAGSSVEWRGVIFRLQPDGTVVPESEWESFRFKLKSIRLALNAVQKIVNNPQHPLMSKLYAIYIFWFSTMGFMAAVFVERLRAFLAGTTQEPRVKSLVARFANFVCGGEISVSSTNQNLVWELMVGKLLMDCEGENHKEKEE